MTVLAIAGADAATAFIEIGVMVVVLALLARIAHRFAISAIPLFLLAGLSVGEGGFARLAVSSEFIELVAEIGVLLLLLTLGLEYSAEELRHGLRTGIPSGTVDALANFVPGVAVGAIIGWELPAAVLLGGVTWVSSSGIVAKVLSDLDRLGNRETPAVLNLLVIEDLAMAVFLPVAAALAIGRDGFSTARTVAVALVAVGVILLIALRLGDRLSSVLEPGTDESLLLAVFGLTLLVGGIAQRFEVSAAIGAFLVGLALSGRVQERAAAMIEPLRDLFAAVFFLFFGFQIAPDDIVRGLAVATVLLVLGAAGKLLSGAFAAARVGAARPGRIRAGVTLIARGEFSVVIASLGATLDDGPQLAAVTAAFVLLTAVVGPLAAKRAGAVPRPTPAH